MFVQGTMLTKVIQTKKVKKKIIITTMWTPNNPRNGLRAPFSIALLVISKQLL